MVNDDVISKELNEAMNAGGINRVGMSNYSHDYAAYSKALSESKKSTPFGAFVDNKTIEELQERGAKVFMSDDGMVGVAVMNDNNIVGVFKNGQFNQKGVSEEMIYTARD